MRLDRRRFQAWLAAQAPDKIVGEQRSCLSCPIARFYIDASGGSEVVIFDRGDGYRMDRGDGGRRLPDWANYFIFQVDGEPHGGITAKRAIEILAQI